MVASFADWWIERWGLNCDVGLPVSRLRPCFLPSVFIVPFHKLRASSAPMAPEVTATVVDDNPEAYEERHVHAVYDNIASHFSSTRYKVANITIPHLPAILSDNSLGPSSQNFCRIFPPDGWDLTRGLVMGNTLVCPRIIQGRFGQSDWTEVKVY